MVVCLLLSVADDASPSPHHYNKRRPSTRLPTNPPQTTTTTIQLNQSARRIPTEEQRGIWLAYTRGKFREGQRLDDARRVRRALEDGREQLGRMNYFHEVRERKEAMEAARAGVASNGHGGVGNGHAGQQHHHRQQLQQHRPPLGQWDGDGEPRQDIGHRGDQQHRYAPAEEWELLGFLERSLPGAKREDLARYEAELREEGFGDAPGMLGYLKEGDLVGWKKAHARAFLAAVRREVGKS